MVNWPKAAYRKRFANVVPTHTHTNTQIDERARTHNKQLIQFEMAIIADKLLLVILYFVCAKNFSNSFQLQNIFSYQPTVKWKNAKLSNSRRRSNRLQVYISTSIHTYTYVYSKLHCIQSSQYTKSVSILRGKINQSLTCNTGSCFLSLCLFLVLFLSQIFV